ICESILDVAIRNEDLIHVYRNGLSVDCFSRLEIGLESAALKDRSHAAGSESRDPALPVQERREVGRLVAGEGRQVESWIKRGRCHTDLCIGSCDIPLSCGDVRSTCQQLRG